MDHEAKFEALIREHPYLVGEDLVGVPVASQERFGRGRVDLLFRKSTGAVIVEIKRTRLKVEDAFQLLLYCRKWARREKMAVRHYLVGKPPADPASEGAIRAVFANSRFDVRLRYIGQEHHIPVSLVWDKKAARYIKGCGDIEDLKLRI